MAKYRFCLWNIYHTLPDVLSSENFHWSAEFTADSVRHAYERGMYEAFQHEYSASDTVTRLYRWNILTNVWEDITDAEESFSTPPDLEKAVIVDRLTGENDD